MQYLVLTGHLYTAARGKNSESFKVVYSNGPTQKHLISMVESLGGDETRSLGIILCVSSHSC